MPNKMLIDATHPEETRVVVLRGNRVEEFDFESANRKQLRGNIYLAKVTRVEPSLQAAFIDYGGNRHGFLAFSEIHPDYYQIPVADRQALIDEEERAARAADAEADHRAGRRARREYASARTRDEIKSEPTKAHEGQEDNAAMAALSERMAPAAGLAEGDEAHPGEHEQRSDEPHFEQPQADEQRSDAQHSDTRHLARSDSHDEPRIEEAAPAAAGSPIEHAGGQAPGAHAGEEPYAGDAIPSTDDAPPAHAEASEPGERDRELAETNESAESSEGGHNITEVNGNGAGGEEDAIESVGGADAMEEVPERMYRPRRQYKIQEVIKRRQVMLVQVVKEERGTKGAALTTYLSLAGRYSVLMPNTARGGGISRKITSAEDRRRLKSIAQDLEVPEGMGVILRTAGAARTKTEVKRDFEYLLRLWETVRDLTLKSTAPTLVYEEGSLVKRSIRDLYNKDIDEILVAGEEGYKEAKEFMRMLMPSHAKNVKLFHDALPVFTRYGIESQLDAMFQPVVQLRSGGYIVLNQAEALVAIDVNSGRATREHHIEDTALKTNLEAAEEIARQLRLRDLAGLIVIDFIDMDEKRNNRTVERRLKESLKHDRARIQVGHISHFGLLEMSRQRIRSSVLESTTDKCPHCGGSGHVRSVSSVALQLLRALEEMLLKGATHNLIVRTRTEIALYLLNQKRAHLRVLEERFRLAIMINADATIGGQVAYVLEKGEQVHSLDQAKAIAAQPMTFAPTVDEEDDETEDEIAEDVDEEAEEAAGADGELHDSERGNGEHVNGERSAGERGDVEHGNGRRRRRRRRGRRGEEDRSGSGFVAEPAADQGAAGDPEGEEEPAEAVAPGHGGNGEQSGPARAESDPRRRRRGRRGGRRTRRGRDGEGPQPTDDLTAAEAEQHVSDTIPQPAIEPTFEHRDFEPPPPREREQAPEAVHHMGDPAPQAQHWQPPVPEAPQPPSSEPPPPVAEPAATRRRSTVREPAPTSFGDASGTATPASVAMPVSSVEPPQPVVVSAETEEGTRARRSGWWSKRVFGKE